MIAQFATGLTLDLFVDSTSVGCGTVMIGHIFHFVPPSVGEFIRHLSGPSRAKSDGPIRLELLGRRVVSCGREHATKVDDVLSVQVLLVVPRERLGLTAERHGVLIVATFVDRSDGLEE